MVAQTCKSQQLGSRGKNTKNSRPAWFKVSVGRKTLSQRGGGEQKVLTNMDKSLYNIYKVYLSFFKVYTFWYKLDFYLKATFKIVYNVFWKENLLKFHIHQLYFSSVTIQKIFKQCFKTF